MPWWWWWGSLRSCGVVLPMMMMMMMVLPVHAVLAVEDDESHSCFLDWSWVMEVVGMIIGYMYTAGICSMHGICLGQVSRIMLSHTTHNNKSTWCRAAEWMGTCRRARVSSHRFEKEARNNFSAGHSCDVLERECIHHPTRICHMLRIINDTNNDCKTFCCIAFLYAVCSIQLLFINTAHRHLTQAHFLVCPSS